MIMACDDENTDVQMKEKLLQIVSWVAKKIWISLGCKKSKEWMEELHH